MQQDIITYIIDPEPSAYVTLLAVPCEIARSRGTLWNYLTFLGIDPLCFHIGTRSLSISHEAMVKVKHLKQEPTLLAQRSFPGILPGSSERKDT